MSDTDAYNAERERLWQDTVASFTAAARLAQPKHGSLDFADFLTSALRATAANLVDPRLLTAGRPGSWESANLAELLQGTIGLNPTMFELAEYRTEPIPVTLNVADLVDAEEGTPGAPTPYDDAIYYAYAKDDVDLVADITREYSDAYRAYAKRFTAAVQAEAGKHPGLSDHIIITTDTGLTVTGVQNPIEFDSDPLVWHLWATARETVGLPTIPETGTS